MKHLAGNVNTPVKWTLVYVFYYYRVHLKLTNSPERENEVKRETATLRTLR